MKSLNWSLWRSHASDPDGKIIRFCHPSTLDCNHWWPELPRARVWERGGSMVHWSESEFCDLIVCELCDRINFWLVLHATKMMSRGFRAYGMLGSDTERLSLSFALLYAVYFEQCFFSTIDCCICCLPPLGKRLSYPHISGYSLVVELWTGSTVVRVQ